MTAAAWQPLEWRSRCWAVAGRRRRPCRAHRSAHYLTCNLHRGLELEARRLYFAGLAHVLEGLPETMRTRCDGCPVSAAVHWHVTITADLLRAARDAGHP